MIMAENPSSYTKDYWIFAFSPAYKEEELTEIHKRLIKKKRMLEKNKLKTGKWLIFVNRENIDEVWEKIKSATV